MVFFRIIFENEKIDWFEEKEEKKRKKGMSPGTVAPVSEENCISQVHQVRKT